MLYNEPHDIFFGVVFHHLFSKHTMSIITEGKEMANDGPGQQRQPLVFIVKVSPNISIILSPKAAIFSIYSPIV